MLTSSQKCLVYFTSNGLKQTEKGVYKATVQKRLINKHNKPT